MVRTTFRKHAGLQFALAVAGLLAATSGAVPFLPPLTNEWVPLGIGIALLVPLHIATIVRSNLLALRSKGLTTRANQWRALLALPRPAHILMACVGLAGAALLVSAGADDSHLENPGSAQGRYFAVDTTDPRRQRIEITRRAYEGLRKDDQTTLFAGYALLAAAGGGLTLVFAQLDAWSDEG
ncbi:hypothetical protein ACF065_21255 [Streptomyces sp. NPDC015232]|uniref:hypothetical protein n=1 Tax=unclassified Streptomyces TaxID=2593676 RepID=UPI003702B01D